MAFKAKKSVIDIDLDLTELVGKEEGNIKPVKEPNGENVILWQENVKKAELEPEDYEDNEDDEDSKKKKKRKIDPKEATELMIAQIDFWYNKGKKFWLTKIPFPVLQDVMEYLNKQFFRLKKK